MSGILDSLNALFPHPAEDDSEEDKQKKLAARKDALQKLSNQQAGPDLDEDKTAAFVQGFKGQK